MARQVRSEATRRKIFDAAIDVFGDVGFAAAGWGTIIERTGMTKGALYHHFDSKEALASAVIQEGSQSLLNAFRNVCGASSPGLENMVHGTFTVVKTLNSDKMARTAVQLASGLSGYNEAVSRFYASLVAEMADQARRAVAEGDVRDDVDPEVVSESIVGAVFGTLLLSDAVSRNGAAPNGDADEPTVRLRHLWELLLPGVVSDASLAYFRQFLRREAVRHTPVAAAREGAGAEPTTT
ncbi:TetR/AcrR family transcriptional regulator [Mycobacterium sp. Marseille-P9652]|uniref:TetR/AcrR family transcriptional regulator n=1 Tax=Mycobacterium sp. Marseille-P9652 TaxID=2654950 RepID=UPI0012E77430|nr:TetR/AcrR family transcriptional regulator [Mycobacterium sp. Marseille-P9652]